MCGQLFRMKYNLGDLFDWHRTCQKVKIPSVQKAVKKAKERRQVGRGADILLPTVISDDVLETDSCCVGSPLATQ